MKKYILNYFSYKYAVMLTLVAVLLYTNFNCKRWSDKKVITWDVTSYYGYLPALFIHGDLSLKFIEGKESQYANAMQFWPETAENGGKVIKTTMGMSILYAPFFAIAHAHAYIMNYEMDGFSEPYHRWVHLSALFYLVIGMFFLLKLLGEIYDTPLIGNITLVLIILGTNAFYYVTTEAAMSHIYTFSLTSVLLYLYHSWLNKITLFRTLLIGLVLGLIVLIRPINVLLLLFLLLYKIHHFRDLQNRFIFFLENYKSVLIIGVISFLILLPQFIYWKLITGNWFFNSYVGEGFFFSNPHLWDGFFSFRKGWLLYTPIMIFALVGFYFLYRKKKSYFWAPIIYFMIFTYLIFSWWSWWYGGSFGLRAMIDIYPILAIPFAAFVSYFVLHKNKNITITMSVLSFILVCHNFFEILQYRRNIIHWDSMTKEAYIKSFGKLSVQEGYWELMKSPDYDKAKAGEEQY